MKKKYIVKTHLGDFPTWATSPGKAINNIRWRLFGGSPASKRYAAGWTARAA